VTKLEDMIKVENDKGRERVENVMLNLSLYPISPSLNSLKGNGQSIKKLSSFIKEAI
jgi:hypothetical protein